jgi:hypothetical protein
MLNVPGKICCGSAALIIWTLNEGRHAMTDRDKKLIRNSTAELLELQINAPFTVIHPQGIRGVFSPVEINEILQLTERLAA